MVAGGAARTAAAGPAVVAGEGRDLEEGTAFACRRAATSAVTGAAVVPAEDGPLADRGVHEPSARAVATSATTDNGLAGEAGASRRGRALAAEGAGASGCGTATAVRPATSPADTHPGSRTGPFAETAPKAPEAATTATAANTHADPRPGASARLADNRGPLRGDRGFNGVIATSW